MPLAHVIGYVIVFGLPIWLVAEEIAHRLAVKGQAETLVPARVVAPAVAPAGLERRVA
ncbi:MAG: hypothetical protein ACREKH_20755 [Candidatus Rokuibacteriota bacterium]